jgi:outer membrane protein OmpA-like peptidoglycan-associated protein
MTSRFERFLPLAKKSGASVIVASGVAMAPLAANAQTLIDHRDSGSVSVDLSVLNELGRPATVPQLLQPSVRTLLMPNARTTTNRSRFRAGLNPPPTAGSLKLIPPSAKRRAPKPRRATTRPAARLLVKKPAAPKIAAAPKAAPKPLASAPRPAPVAKAPPPPPPPASTASKPPAPKTTGKLSPGQQYRIGFAPNAAAIGSGEGSELDGIAKSMKGDDALRLQLLAYAGGAAQTPSQARRLSLSRALAVRSHLIEKGIGSTRIDVRALGNKSEGGPPDRVDIIITTR